MNSTEAAVLHLLLEDKQDDAWHALRNFTQRELQEMAMACQAATRIAMQVYYEKEEQRKQLLTPQQRLIELFDRR